VGVGLVCLRRAEGASEFTWWTDLAEALEAERVLCRPTCGPKCGSAHVVAFSNNGCCHVVGPHPRAPDLAVELAQCYRRRVDNPPPEYWPTPAAFNAPFTGRPVGSRLTERIAHGEATALRRQLATVAPNRPPVAPGPDDPATPGVVACAATHSTPQRESHPCHAPTDWRQRWRS
jgi:hypothetical protein